MLGLPREHWLVCLLNPESFTWILDQLVILVQTIHSGVSPLPVDNVTGSPHIKPVISFFRLDVIVIIISDISKAYNWPIAQQKGILFRVTLIAPQLLTLLLLLLLLIIITVFITTTMGS